MIANIQRPYRFVSGGDAEWADISTMSYDSKTFSVSAQEGLVRNFFIKGDGTKLYIVGTSTDKLYQYTLSTPWDISTSSAFQTEVDITGEITAGTAHSMFMSDSGLRMYITGLSAGKVFQYSGSTPWDLDTFSYDSDFYDFTSENANMLGIFMNGEKVYLNSFTSDLIYQYSM